MKILAATIASLGLMASSMAHGEQTKSSSAPTPDDIRTVAPALEKYRSETVAGDLWKRPGLAPRDRSIVTLAALIARNQQIEMADQLDRALDNGVKPREISEVITHLAFYAGWGNAMLAVAVAKDVFAERKIGADQLAPVSVELLPLDEAAEAARANYAGRIRQKSARAEGATGRAGAANRTAPDRRGDLPNHAGKPNFRGFAGRGYLRAFENRAKARIARFRVFEPRSERKKARVFLAFALRPDGQSAGSCKLAGEPGFEPGPTESESVVLPLNYSPAVRAF